MSGRGIHPRPAGAAVVAWILAILFSASRAQAWEIQSFEADLAVREDGTLDVTETIEADFRLEKRHGIYRDIPLTTEDRLGVKRSIRVHFKGAFDDQGRPWEAKLSGIGPYLRIRLGSEDKTYNGRKTFRISYRVERSLGHYPEHDELYWNATGNGWAVPNLQAAAVVRLPGPVPSGKLRSLAYTGAHGSTGQEALVTPEGDNAVRYTARRPLNPFEGLTIVAGWPHGIVRMPGRAKRLAWFLQDNWPFAIPAAVFLAMFSLWWSGGRDPKPESIPVQYEPPERLSPAEAGALIDDHIDLRDVTATIIDLARRGYLTLEELAGKDYILTRKGPPAGGPELRPYEALLLKFLFYDGDAVRLSDLENKFYQHLPGLHQAIYQDLIKEGYWRGRPDRVRGFWWGVSIAVVFAGFFAVAALASSINPMVTLGAVLLSAVILFGFSWFMPCKSRHGARLAEKVRGFQEFLRRVDEDRIRREQDPAALFERMLPYAMAFGVANQWARAFEGIYQFSPAWFTGYDGRSFTPGDFTRRMNSASDRMASSLSSTPRSSGGSGFSGGFSGGGGGGGGGGAW